VKLRGPMGNFTLPDDPSQPVVLLAGGIGITPIITMADRLKRIGKDYHIHYAGRSLDSMAFLDRLQRDHGDRLRLYAKTEGGRLDLDAVVAAAPAEAQIYACGPDRLLSALQQIVSERPECLHVEYFSSAGVQMEPGEETPFEVELKDSGLSVVVPAGQTLLHTLQAAGIDVPSDCEEGLCGTCEVAVVAGDVEHRDKVLSAAERAAGGRMMACCSRARGKLVLAL
jgi:ferredoxin-NADP reductase